MEAKIEKLIRQLTGIFWSLFASILLLGIVILFLQYRSFSYMGNGMIDAQTTIVFESIGVILLLGCIPLALKIYHQKVQKEPLPENDDKKIEHIKKWFFIRIFLVEITLIFNLFVYFCTLQESAIFCCGITTVFFFFFCRPNRNEILNAFSKNENKNEIQ